MQRWASWHEALVICCCLQPSVCLYNQGLPLFPWLGQSPAGRLLAAAAGREPGQCHLLQPQDQDWMSAQPDSTWLAGVLRAALGAFAPLLLQG